jgi:hypothetical protein
MLCVENWNLIQEGKPGKRSVHWSKKMLPKVQKAVYRKEYIIEVYFSDSTSGDIDFAGELHGE